MAKNNIYYRRKQLELTLEQIANYVGVTKSTVAKWESGYIENMKRDKIILLAQVLQLSPIDILNMDETNYETIDSYSSDEKEIINNYRKLNHSGKKALFSIISDYTSISHYTNNNSLKSVPTKKRDDLILRAAHERTDIELTKDGQQNDDNIMNDDSAWE